MSKKDKASKGSSAGKNIKAIKKQIKQDISRLDKEMVEYCNDPHLFSEFTLRIENWYSHPYVKQMFSHLFDGLGTVVSYENFVAGLIDLNAPCNELERHILARLLDPGQSGNISYSNLEFLLWTGYADRGSKEPVARKSFSSPGNSRLTERKYIDMTERKLSDVSVTCGLFETGWVHLYIKMIKFDRFPEHPGNFEMDFPDNVNFDVMALAIKKMLDFPTTNFQLYAHPNPTAEHKIHLSESFRDIGILGGTKLAPIELIIYYDFKVGFMDDALVSELQF